MTRQLKYLYEYISKTQTYRPEVSKFISRTTETGRKNRLSNPLCLRVLALVSLIVVS